MGVSRWSYGDDMEQRLSIVTLGVRDLAVARRFYESLGWVGQGVEATVFFQVGGLAVILWGRDELAEDVGIRDDGATFGGIVLAHNVRSRTEVDDVLAREAELLAGHAEVGIVGMITVTADSRDALEAAVTAIHAAATQASLDLRRVYGQQLQAFTAAALPLGIEVIA